jgi:1,4-alpha-glucan branching enzyme
MAQRRNADPRRRPVSIYEVHLGSWRRVPEEGDRSLTYRETADLLIAHVRRFGFTHIELLPVMEHPFDGSWGYQVSGYYAPTSRFGTPDDFRALVDRCHQAGIGVILDWVPAHFPKDDFALRRFDGTALYEHEDPRKGEHPDWGTLIFNYGRAEVRNFLIANALYWLDEFHVDGLRVDAVASMLYLDYSRKEGEWIPNRYGGRENIEAIDFFRALNEVIRIEYPGCMTIAEESTSWPGVTQPTSQGGLGFTFKWNMGWMHDTLSYFSRDPVHRRYHQDTLTFAMLYEHSERFVMPLSHDEVVHGKGSLLNKMPGDVWQKFANLRLLLAYQFTRPGKMLLFMGTELAPEREWSHETSLDWHLADDPQRAALQEYLADLGRLYLELPELWRKDPDPEGFAWIDCSDRDNSVISYVRRDGERHVVVVLNLTPVPRENYRIGAPRAGTYIERLSSDDRRYGGSEVETYAEVHTEAVPFHGYEQSMRLRLPPLGALILTSPCSA